MTPEQIRIMIDASLPSSLPNDWREKITTCMVDIADQAVEDCAKIADISAHANLADPINHLIASNIAIAIRERTT